jgi:hypothetical protein
MNLIKAIAVSVISILWSSLIIYFANWKTDNWEYWILALPIAFIGGCIAGIYISKFIIEKMEGGKK